MRHGVYAYSSKEWDTVKKQIMDETNKAKADYLKKKEAETAKMTKEEREQQSRDEEAAKVKKAVLPTKVQVADDD